MVRDKGGLSFARKAMLQCGLGIKNGVWKIQQWKPELQEIIPENRSHFDGEPVPSLGADVEVVVMMNKSRILSVLQIDMILNISGLHPNLQRTLFVVNTNYFLFLNSVPRS